MSGPKKRGARLPPFALLVLAGLALAVSGAVLLLAPRGPDDPAVAVSPLPEPYSYGNDWGASREQGAHEGTDLYVPRGTSVYSITAGTVTPTRGTEDGWNRLGGYAVTIRADSSVGPVREGDVLYYAHMDAPIGLEPGDRVEAGQQMGEVGDTGGGPPGTRGRFVPHLHLGWYDGSTFGSRSDAPSGAMNPYPLLRWLESGGGTRTALSTPPTTPSTTGTGPGSWAASSARPLRGGHGVSLNAMYRTTALGFDKASRDFERRAETLSRWRAFGTRRLGSS